MDKTSSYVGPIRSARPTDPLVRPYEIILVVSGATAGLIQQSRLGVQFLKKYLLQQCLNCK